MRLHVVPHTHWDREWYLPFETLRARLVEVADAVLDLARGPYAHFHLDGQVAMVEDYLEVRPERRKDLVAAVARGALSCGPWLTLVDEFSVSGESIVRNLGEGLERAARLGGALMVGYLPDQFGHIGQMPQILRMFGIGRALVWRVAARTPRKPEAVALKADKSGIIVGGGKDSFRLTFDDQDDAGDLYSFCPQGPIRIPDAVEVAGGRALVSFAGSALELSARRAADEPFVRLDVVVHNHRPDHRLRLVLELAEEASGSVALAPFELVARPLVGEGGPGEPGSPWWPARGGVWAGGRALLAEGVFEYEVTGPGLAATLLRATGTISRQEELVTRKAPAGPAVATPGAQMLRSFRRAFGVMLGARPEDLPAAADRFALFPAVRRVPGGGRLPSSGRLLELQAPALSAVRRGSGRLEVRVYNPAPEPGAVCLEGAELPLPPFAIRTLAAG